MNSESNKKEMNIKEYEEEKKQSEKPKLKLKLKLKTVNNIFDPTNIYDDEILIGNAKFKARDMTKKLIDMLETDRWMKSVDESLMLFNMEIGINSIPYIRAKKITTRLKIEDPTFSTDLLSNDPEIVLYVRLVK